MGKAVKHSGKTSSLGLRPLRAGLWPWHYAALFLEGGVVIGVIVLRMTRLGWSAVRVVEVRTAWVWGGCGDSWRAANTKCCQFPSRDRFIHWGDQQRPRGECGIPDWPRDVSDYGPKEKDQERGPAGKRYIMNRSKVKGPSIFPGGSDGKESACQYRRHRRCGFDPWVGKMP